MVNDEFVEAVAKGIYFLDVPLMDTYSHDNDWERMIQKEKDLYIAKAKFVLTYVKQVNKNG